MNKTHNREQVYLVPFFVAFFHKNMENLWKKLSIEIYFVLLYNLIDKKEFNGQFLLYQWFISPY